MLTRVELGNTAAGSPMEKRLSVGLGQPRLSLDTFLNTPVFLGMIKVLFLFFKPFIMAGVRKEPINHVMVR